MKDQSKTKQALIQELDSLRRRIAELEQSQSERKRAEVDKEKLEAQNRQLQKAESLGRMASAIAHHFNNKLSAVMGNLDMALEKLLRGAEPIENLTAAMQATVKAAEVSSLMLTYLGQTPGKREPLDLSEACLQNLPMLRAAMPGKVVLETDLPSPGPAIRANANQMQQVLTNLITNAWEAVGEDGGSIHLRVNTVPPADIPAAHCYPLNWQQQENAYACLEVTDAGCGIADKDIEKLFDPFFSSKFTGRGLGLAVVMGIVRAHGGAVTVESEPGIGSAFRVFFPVSVEEVPRQMDFEAQAPEMEGGGTVLLVEDEEMVRDMAAAMLKSLGFTVLEAKDGVEAVEVYRQHRDEIRCVLCDLTMRRMNGGETLAALRKLAPDIPVILVSGYDKVQVMAGGHPEWPQVFLGKPYRIKELSDAISQALINKKK
jgi:two-component system cell cycle sensor histidine kinase/response regulator CckA